MDHFGKRILVVEDDGEMRDLLKDFLKSEGYEVDSADNGSEAFRNLAKQSFDLIITDVRMPGLSGLDILPGIKKLQPQASVIVITAFGSDDVCHRAFEKGASVYLKKPIHLPNLGILIHKLLPAKTAEEEEKNGWNSGYFSRKVS